MELWEQANAGYFKVGIFMGSRRILNKYEVGSQKYLEILGVLYGLAQSIDLSKLDPAEMSSYYDIEDIQIEFDLVNGLYDLACVEYRDEMIKLKLGK